MEPRYMFIVRWTKLRKSSQDERDILFEKMHGELNEDETYTVSAETVAAFENELDDEEKKQFKRLLKSMHKLVAREGEAFITIT